MSDIFISYARENKAKAKILFDTLTNQGFSVWWDPEIPPGEEFRQVITKALDEAKCVIVLWSKASVGSRWVREEANRGDRRGILIPALIESIEMPLGFGEIQAVRLVDWKGSPSHAEFNRLLQAVCEVLQRPVIVVGKPWYKSRFFVASSAAILIALILVVIWLIRPPHLILTLDENNPFVDGNEVSFKFIQSEPVPAGTIDFEVRSDDLFDATISSLSLSSGGTLQTPKDTGETEGDRVKLHRYELGDANEHTLKVTVSGFPVRLKVSWGRLIKKSEIWNDKTGPE